MKSPVTTQFYDGKRTRLIDCNIVTFQVIVTLFNFVMSTAAVLIVQNGPLLLLTISYSLLMSRPTPNTIHEAIEDSQIGIDHKLVVKLHLEEANVRL